MRLVEVEILDEEVKFVYLNGDKGLICKNLMILRMHLIGIVT